MIKFEFPRQVIYHLIKDGVVVYAGQTKNVIHRLLAHKNDNSKNFDEVAFMYYDDEDISIKEFSEIVRYKPIHNKVFPTFKFALYRDKVQKINSALKLGNIEHKGYDIERPDFEIKLNGKTFSLWKKIGSEDDFDLFLSKLDEMLRGKQ